MTRPGYNANPNDWVRYADHLEAEVERLCKEMAVREGELSVANLWSLHDEIARLRTENEDLRERLSDPFYESQALGLAKSAKGRASGGEDF